MSDATHEETILILIRQKKMNDGFKLIMDTYQERLYAAFRRILNSHDDANDVLQNTFLKVFEKINDFKHNSSLYTWMYKIGFNECMALIKMKKKLSTAPLEPNIKQEENNDIFKEVEEEIMNVLNQLPEKQRLVFEMRYYDKIKYAEISELTGVSIGALKANYHHAIQKIKSHFQQRKLN